MTFLQLQDRVMARLVLSSPETRERIRTYLNERYRRIVTSVSLGSVRRGTTTFATVNGTEEYTPSGVIKVLGISYPAGNRRLMEQSEDVLRNIDPDDSTTGDPDMYAVVGYGATSTRIKIFPVPNAAYTLEVNALLAGTDMDSDDDVPAFPEDFHDALVFGAMADELEKQERPEASQAFEARFEKRLGELRYFLQRSAYLHTQQGTTPEWWYGPLASTFFGW